MPNKAILVAGLGFGDEGKGTITEYLCKRHSAEVVVRYNGGAQAAHNIVTDDGRHHTFSQFGSATLSGAMTYLSRFMVVDPLAMLKEAEHLVSIGVRDPMGKVYIDQDALVILPYHRAANRLRELERGGSRHGSCGVGVGEARDMFIRYGHDNSVIVNDLYDQGSFMIKANWIQSMLVSNFIGLPEELKDTPEYDLLHMDLNSLWKKYDDFTRSIGPSSIRVLDRLFNRSNVVFEGAQGVLLDEKYGFYPYMTWTDITFANANTLMKYIGFSGIIEKIGVIRSYMTRHGAGPMPTEVKDWRLGEQHNKLDQWQGEFREGHLDIPLLRYSLDVIGGVDKIAMTHMDLKPAQFCMSYNDSCIRSLIKVSNPTEATQEALGKYLYSCRPNLSNFSSLNYISHLLDTPISIISNGPKLSDKVEL